MSTIFRSIVQQVTQENLKELKQQRNIMNDHFKPALNYIAEPKVNPVKALRVLYDAVKTAPFKDIIDNILIDDLKHVIKNGEEDPSLSTQLVWAWIDKVKQEIQYSLNKCEYSYMHGSLLSEWLELEKRKTSRKSAACEGEGIDNPSEPKEKVKRDKDEVVERLKRQMFTLPSSDEFEEEKFRKFLSDELLNFEENATSYDIMNEIRQESEKFFGFTKHHISSRDVLYCIHGLSMEELLSPEKKVALKELIENKEALKEVALLLTNRLRNLKQWEWPSSCDVVEVRRGIAGEYKAFMNEDILTAIFLRYVGVKWASYFKNQLKRIYISNSFTKPDCGYPSIQSKREAFYLSTFLACLPDSTCYQESETIQVRGSATLGIGLGLDSSASARSQETNIDLKQDFMYILSTEIRLHQVIQPEKPLVVVQAVSESFESSVIQDAAIVALEYFGVSNEWLEFFKKFLQPRVAFGENEKPELVVRGVLASHTLSTLFVEILLFLLDLIVNQKCAGMKIFRIDNEFWFADDTTENMTKAWETMNTYGKMVGLKIKEDRSGSVTIFSNETISKIQDENLILRGPSPLPQRSVHWGYFELYSNGDFKIDQMAITTFLDELRGLLDTSECVLEWINVFNNYLEFFMRNFGECAIVFGKQYLDQIITSLATIYSGLFGSENGNPVEKLKSRFEKLREVDIVDAWVYWPLERGGLGLVNPFIRVMSLREIHIQINDTDHFTKLPLEDKVLWEQIVEKQKTLKKPDATSPTWEEYTAKRETELVHWHKRYNELLERPYHDHLLQSKIPKLDYPYPQARVYKTYLVRLLSYYETQLLLHFGSLNFLYSKLLPMSMIAHIQKWNVQQKNCMRKSIF